MFRAFPQTHYASRCLTWELFSYFSEAILFQTCWFYHHPQHSKLPLLNHHDRDRWLLRARYAVRTHRGDVSEGKCSFSTARRSFPSSSINATALTPTLPLHSLLGLTNVYILRIKEVQFV